MTCCS